MPSPEQRLPPPFNIKRYGTFANRPTRTVGRYFDWLTHELDEGRAPDVGEHIFYVEEYANVLVRRFLDDRDYESFIAKVEALRASYESVGVHTHRFARDAALVAGRWGDAWAARGEKSANLVRTVGKHLGSQRLIGWETVNLSNRRGFTGWALSNLDDWLAAIEEIADEIQAQAGVNWVDALCNEWEPRLGSIDERVADDFFDELDLGNPEDNSIRYVLRDLEYQQVSMSWDEQADYVAFRRVPLGGEADDGGVVVQMVGLMHWMEFAVRAKARWICREAENLVRSRAGVPNVGKGWISESELYQVIKECFPETLVQQHASPAWLAPQHLDVFLPKYNIGVEFQGEQHFRPIEFFGGEEGFRRGQDRDEAKRWYCEQAGCHLIEVSKGYDAMALLDEIREVIESRS